MRKLAYLLLALLVVALAPLAALGHGEEVTHSDGMGNEGTLHVLTEDPYGACAEGSSDMLGDGHASVAVRGTGGGEASWGGGGCP